MNEVLRLRKKHGLTQDKLAKLSGLSQSQVHRLERGSRRMKKEMAEKLAPALQTSPQRLIFPEGTVTVGFDERLLRLSKALGETDFDRLVGAIDLIIRAAELVTPEK